LLKDGLPGQVSSWGRASLGVTGTVEPVVQGPRSRDTVEVTEDITNHSCLTAFLIHNEESKI